MNIPQYLRLTDDVPEAVSAEELTPLVYRVMTQYHSTLNEEYEGSLLSPEELTKVSLRDHHFVLINDDYLFAYQFGTEWFSTQSVIVEVFIIRVGKGKTTLKDVFEVLRMLTRLHGVRETQLSPRSDPALHRLYQRSGAVDVTQIMRIL